MQIRVRVEGKTLMNLIVKKKKKKRFKHQMDIFVLFLLASKSKDR